MADLIIKIGAESKQFQEELDKISAKTEDLEDQLGSIAKVSGVAFAALTAEATLALRAFQESEEASQRLSAALQSQGIFSAELADSYKAQAKELQNLTGIDDDAIVKAQSFLQNMIGQTEITPDLTKAIVDLSAAKQMDLDTTAELIGKGINGQTTALKKLGIEIDDHLTKEERTAQIIERVTQSFGGQAEAMNQGLGSVKGLKSAFSDFQEEIGARLAPAMTLIIQKVTQFFRELAENKPLLDVITHVGVFLGVATGMVTTLAAGALAFIKVKAAVEAASIAFGIARVGVAALVGATGIGLIALLVTELALNWNTAWPKMQAIFKAFVDNIAALAGGFGNVLAGIFNVRSGVSQIKEGIAQIKAAWSKGFSEFEAINVQNQKKLEDNEKAGHARQNAAQQQAANQRTSELKRQQDLELQLREAHQETLAFQTQQTSKQLIDISKEEEATLKALTETKNAEERAQLEDHLAQIRAIKENEVFEDVEKNITLQEEVLANNEEFQAMTEEQQQEFLSRNQGQLLSQTETESSTRRNAALQRANEQVKANNQFLADQMKFGTAYAQINRVMHSEIFQGSKQAFGELAQLTQSSNSTLKGIGKVAAIANIIIKTAESAMSIYAGFSTIPIVGPALGVAGAAAAVAFGAEQVQRVNAAADGGIMTGGISGRDSIPSLLMPGELVVPTRNFSEVVNAVAAQQRRDEGLSSGGGIAGVEGTVGVAIEFNGEESEKVITARQVEARALGTYRAAT